MKPEDKQKTPSQPDAPVVHIYDDDLVEEDNVLPRWWLYTLYGTVMFAFIYWYGEHQIGAWKGRADSFNDEMAAIRQEELKKGGPIAPETLVALSKTPATVEEGHQVFTTTCAPCHRADGGGNIGPNLTDEFWLHGSKPENIYTTIHDGVAAKGMPAWGPQLGDQKVAAAAAYVLSIRDTHVAGGKTAQGEKEM